MPSANGRAFVDERPPSKLKVAGVVVFYMVSALVMVFVNKAVLNSTPELPFTFLFIQLTIAVLLLHILAFVVPEGSSLKAKVALPEINAETAYKLLPVVSVGVVALVFNTLCLRNVDASFFQIARGLLLPCTILVSALHTRLAPRSPVIRAAALVTVGFFLGISPSSFFKSSDLPAPGEIIGSADAISSNITGGRVGQALGLEGMDGEKVLALVYGTLSALMTAVHAVLVKSAVKTLEGSVLRLTYWSNFLSGAFLLPCILLNGEASIFISKIVLGLPPATTTATAASLYAYDASVERTTFLVGSLITGFFGFLLGLAGLLSIKVTSPVSHMVSSAVRSVLQTVLGVVLFGEVVTGRRASSVGVITLGALYYTWIQSSGAPPPPPPSTAVEGETEEMMKEKGGKPTRPAALWRSHGATNSLATLLPLYTPSPTRSRTFPTSPPGSSGGASGSSSPTGRGRLGSISEEEEYYASSGAGHGGGARVLDSPTEMYAGLRGDDEEKIALLDSLVPEDDRERTVRPHHAHIRMQSEDHTRGVRLA